MNFLYENSLLKREMGLFLTVKELSQKKFCSSNLKKIEVFVQSRKEVMDLNLLKEMKKNSLLDLDLLEYEKYLKNFYGYIILFECIGFKTIDGEKEKILGIGFFNLLDTEMEYLEYIDYDYIKYFITDNYYCYNTSFWRIDSETEYNSIIFVLERFLKDIDNIDSVIFGEGKEDIDEFFKEDIVKEYFWDMYMDETKPIRYFCFNNLNDLVQYLKDIQE